MKLLDKFKSLDGLATATSILAILFLAAGVLVPYLKGPVVLVPWLRGIGALFLLLFVCLLAWLRRADLARMLGHKRTKSGAHSALQIVLFLGVLVCLNLIVARHHGRIDLTSNREYSLSDQTRKILENLKQEVRVTSFFQPGNKAVELWKEYTYLSSQVKYTPVDPDQDPAKAAAYGIKRFGTTVIEAGGQRVEIDGTTEQDFTGGILKATRPEKKAIFFLSGHNEGDPEGYDQEALGEAKQALEKQNYRVEKLLLLAKPEVPASASVLVIAGPQKPLLPAEAKAVRAFVEKGGKVMLLLSPQVETGLESWLAGYGITVDDNLVLDRKLNVFLNLATPLVKNYPYHVITQKLPASFFSMSRSLTVARTLPEGVAASPLLETSDDSWGETDLMSQDVEYDEGKDKRGPLKLGFALEIGKDKEQKTRMVVFGNSRFATNTTFGQAGNGDLFLASLNWLAEDEDLISIPPKPSAPEPVVLSNAQIWGTFYGVMLLPFLLLSFGGFVWWRRRR